MPGNTTDNKKEINTEKENTGFLLVEKPEGISSHDVIDYLRKVTEIKKIGHAGTLDPIATGLLIVGVGREATKQISRFLKMDKEYEAVIRLGAVSDTFDREGKIEQKAISEIPSRERIEKAVKNFIGRHKQTPPVFSAKKIKGKKLYELARKGEKPTPRPVEVEIYDIQILNYKWPLLEIKVHCSSGTYIRSLAYDIGEKLGVGGYLENLTRTRIGNFKLEKAKDLKEITSDNWQKLLF